MIPVIRIKDGVQFDLNGKGTISPAGFYILWAAQETAKRINHDITITSAADGVHTGPEDPHPHGRAFDVRTHDLPDGQQALNYLKMYLPDKYFYAFLEDPGTPNEHIHVQQRKNVEFPPKDDDIT